MINNSSIQEIFKFGPEQLGYGQVKSAWSNDGNLISVVGENKVIRVLDRQGKTLNEFNSPDMNRIEDIKWDKDNDSFALLTQANQISIYSMGVRSFSQPLTLGSAKEKASWLNWSATHPVLVVGSDKGSLVFYNRKSGRKIPCISKHGKKVTGGDWNQYGELISCSEDRLITISNYQGDTLCDSQMVKGDPNNIRWQPNSEENNKTMVLILN